MVTSSSAPPPTPPAGRLPLTGEQIAVQTKLLLTKRELSRALPMPERTIEKLVARGVLGCLRITPRMVRFELPRVLEALRRYETATLKK